MSDAERIDYERTIEELRFDKARWVKVAEILAHHIANTSSDKTPVDILFEAYHEAYPYD